MTGQSDSRADTEAERRITRLAAMAEPVRRSLYRWVSAQREPVTREQAANGVGVPHHVAKFNLDRLVDDGFLDADYRRPPGRGGPGAGRPAKVYCRSSGEVGVSVPERHYDVAGLLLARGVAEAERTHTPVATAVRQAAREHGRTVAGEVVSRSPSRRSPLTRAADVLATNGYEPCVENNAITLSNCPFHSLAREEAELVCGMNLALVEGMLDTAGSDTLEAVLQPVEGRCCVRIQRRDPAD